jgi:Uma2 family endonuclease
MPNDGTRYELQAGTIVAEPLAGFRHGRIAMKLGAMLDTHVRRHALGAVLAADTGFVLARDPDTVRGPDISFVRRERLEGAAQLVGAFEGAPDLAVEVLSPSGLPADVHAKVADYLAAGTRLVWVVDPQHESVTVYRSLLSPRRVSRNDDLDGEDVVSGFTTAVAALFEP